MLVEMGLPNVARVALLGAACLAAVGSATSNQNSPPNQPQQQYGGGNAPAARSEAPVPQQMDPSRALGLWRSTFGAVKIEADNAHGGLQMGAVQGVWVYQRQGAEVIGYFHGELRGNVLQFQWNEPPAAQTAPPLNGEGYIAFDQSGRQYSGRWWTDRKDRIGDWNGWRDGQRPQPQAQSRPAPVYGQSPYGDQQPQDQGQYGGADYGYQQPRYAPQPQQAPQRYAPPPRQAPRYPTYPQQPAPPQPAPQPTNDNPYY